MTTADAILILAAVLALSIVAEMAWRFYTLSIYERQVRDAERIKHEVSEERHKLWRNVEYPSEPKK